MPNHVENRLTFECSPEELQKILEDIQYDPDRSNEEYTGIGTFDFNKIVPMPESLNIECGSRTDRSIDYYLNAINPKTADFGIPKYTFDRFTSLVNQLNEKRSFGHFKTRMTGDEIAEATKYDTPDDILKLGKTAVTNFINYGSTGWYDWAIENWGTKWNSYDSWKGQENGLLFSTAWSAPHPVIEALAAKYPNVRITHEWADEDIGNNCGIREYEDGECISEWYPDGDKESVEFACGVWDETPEDHGLLLNATETYYLNPFDRRFDVIDLFGKAALFTSDRLTDSNIPKGLFLYHVRGDDETTGGFAELAPRVLVNHFGSIVTKEPIDFGDDGFIAFTPETEPIFLPVEAVTFSDYLRKDFTPQEIITEQKELSME